METPGVIAVEVVPNWFVFVVNAAIFSYLHKATESA